MAFIPHARKDIASFYAVDPVQLPVDLDVGKDTAGQAQVIGAMLFDELGRQVTLIELGIGSRNAVEQKTLPLLHAFKPMRFVANDLSVQSVTVAKSLIEKALPGLAVEACAADFLDHASPVFNYSKANILLTGSTVSNIRAYDGQLPVNEVVSFLRSMRALATPTGSVIVTQDTNQDEVSLKAAYASPALVKFRLDALYRLKALLGLDSFDPSLLVYEPVWEPGCHLLTNTFVNTKDQVVRVGGKVTLFPKGRRIYVSNCYKYPMQDFLHMSQLAGLEPVKTWLDAEGRVALHVLKAI